MTSLYSLDIILVLFYRIIKQDSKSKHLLTGDWSQSTWTHTLFLALASYILGASSEKVYSSMCEIHRSRSPCTSHHVIFAITKTRLCKFIENFTFKNWKFSDKNSDIFHISAKNIDCGYSLEPPRRGGSNEYPQSMFLSRNKKNNVYPVNPMQFYCIKVGFKGVKII